MRIAVLGISYEALLRSPVPTRKMEVRRGSEMIGNNVWMVRGAEKRAAEADDVELIPLLWATALPGGGFTREIYDQVKAEAMTLLHEAGQVDGVLLLNHGAMEVHDLDRHADTDFVESVREVVGDEIPIALALDLHGHISPRILEIVCAVSAFRTAPHRDDLETGYRALDQLLAVIKTGRKPKIAAVRIPILVPGELSVTDNEPARSLYKMLPDLDSRPGIIETNLLVGFAWNDRPWIGMTAIATSDVSVECAKDAATEIARKVWERRKDFRLEMEHDSVSGALDRAARSAERPLFLTDSGDNTTAGAYGDLTSVLQAILARPELEDVVVAGITAPGIVEQCRKAGEGAHITLTLGDEHVSAPRQPMQVEAVVEACADRFDPTGATTYIRAGSAWSRVRIGHVIATFHSDAIGVNTPDHFRLFGIDPTGHRIYVVKLGYLHPHLKTICPRYILMVSDGASNLDVASLSWSRIPRPAYPVDADAVWTPEPNTYTTPL
ncbi:M81 family metallopeptidase [uncultured Cohaesibacter sp.]|uniref:M81 family metallopeptidase n=1 Tax=uncultured Cohaesibacter sp. TaxID=1002546 RepID=UPI00292E373B|nr:M81 family metallopeptidase [uncultured Cohaesibacter sp.]